MADIFAEVDEIMRQERLQKFWDQHKQTIIAFISATILATAAFSAFNWWNANTQTRQTNAVLTMLDSPDFPAMLENTDLKLRPSLKNITLLTGADAALKQGNEALALSLYEKAAQEKAAPTDLQHLAILMQVRLLENQNSDQDLIALLRPIFKKSNSPWIFYAHLEAATILAHQQQNYEAARAHLNVILDSKNVSPPILQKAQALDHVYAQKQNEPTS